MTIASVIAQLDDEINTLNKGINPAKPEVTPDSFARVRALSLGRSFLRSLPTDSEPTWREVDAAYTKARQRVMG